MPKEKYQANRDNNNQASDSSKKTAKLAAKGAANYFTGGKGGALVDKLADTKLGNDVLNKAGKIVDKNPLLNKVAKKLDESGAIDKADKALSMTNGGSNSKDVTDNIGKKNSLGPNNSQDKDDKENQNEYQNSSSSVFSKDSKESSSFAVIIKGFIVSHLPIILGVSLFMICIMGLTYSIIVDIEENSDNNNNIASQDGTSCIYSIKGFSNGSKTVKRDINISNLKVRLMECDGSKAVSGEELIDFEKYILGVTYQENGSGSDEAVKTQAVAGRSYALSRPAMMGNSGGTKLEEENGQWILQLRSCTNDQAYCDPDKGCWSDRAGGEGATIHSGQNSSKAWSRGPLAADAKTRVLVEQTIGEVLVNSSGYILNTSYLNTDQIKWNTSFPGLNYKQILLQHYNRERNIGASDIVSMSCSTPSNSNKISKGSFAKWKQGDPAWGNIRLGSSSDTIHSAGCLVTSVSMLIAKSNVPTTIDNFNPGTFVQKLNTSGGFQGVMFVWRSASKVAPKFVFQSKIGLSEMSKAEKLSKIKNLTDQGYYVVAEVKGITGQHWVAIDSVSGNTINMMDPASDNTDLWATYNWQNTSEVGYYKVS